MFELQSKCNLTHMCVFSFMSRKKNNKVILDVCAWQKNRERERPLLLGLVKVLLRLFDLVNPVCLKG